MSSVRTLQFLEQHGNFDPQDAVEKDAGRCDTIRAENPSSEKKMSESPSLILVAVGPDQVGLVERISQLIVERGCNIVDSKMAVFLGEFALIALISGEAGSLAEIRARVSELEQETGLSVWLKEPTGKKSLQPSLPYRLAASCMDHPGVVHRISNALSKLGINIESMETETYEAPVSGTPIFRMVASISVPVDLNINTLRERLSEIEKQENIDIELTLLSKS
jgi:glycine cleavage system transcriptional repressor